MNTYPPYRDVCEQQLDEIMDEFDFHKVQRVMEHLDWKWNSCEDGTPSVSMLRRYAREQLRRLVTHSEKCVDGYYSSGSGGFCVSLEKETGNDGVPWVRLKLAFELASETGNCGDGQEYSKGNDKDDSPPIGG